MGIYHNISNVKNIILNTSLNQTIVKSLPFKLNIIYLDKLDDHTSQNPMNLEPVSIIYFNARFVTKIELGFEANPVNFDHALPPVNVNINAVHYGNPNPTKPYYSNPTPPLPNPTPSQSYSAPHRSYSKPNRSKPNPRNIRPCNLCTYKEFNAVHYTLREQCSVPKLSSSDIIKIINITRTCSSCGNVPSIVHQ